MRPASFTAWAINSCFNPRPPLLAGDANFVQLIAQRRAVSIRARHCWRAMPTQNTIGLAFKRFNPRPPLLAGDARSFFRQRRNRYLFQSAPAIAGGRCGRVLPDRGRPGSFNPRPPLLAGDAAECPTSTDTSQVSIRARHCWRAMPAGTSTVTPRSKRFNPRPPLLAGDAEKADPSTLASIVSIRARHCWRAMLQVDQACYASEQVSIRARHCWRAMRIFCFQTRRLLMFQSAPAIAGGRCLHL